MDGSFRFGAHGHPVGVKHRAGLAWALICCENLDAVSSTPEDSTTRCTMLLSSEPLVACVHTREESEKGSDIQLHRS